MSTILIGETGDFLSMTEETTEQPDDRERKRGREDRWQR